MAGFTREDTRERIVSLVAQELKIDTARLHEDVTFQELGADSLDMVQLIMKIEETFGLEINDHDAEHMTTLRTVVDFVMQHRTV